MKWVMMTCEGRGRRRKESADVPGPYSGGGGNPASLLSLFGGLEHGVISILSLARWRLP